MVEKENDIVVVASNAAANNTLSENNATADAATNPASTPPNKSEIKGLAFHFFKAYYTKLSDHPDDIGTFYGDDSIFVHGDLEEEGRENIQRAIGMMNFGGCKSRFYSLQATQAIDQSKVFQVCGELMMKGQPAPRRFCQTIVLSCAPPNVLYVKSNIFQWLDVVFPVNESEKIYFISPPNTVPPQPVENGTGPVAPKPEQPLVNGGSHVVKPVALTPVPTPKKDSEPVIVLASAPPGLEKQPSMIQPAKTPEKPTVNGLPVSEKPPIEVVKDEAETVENAKPEAITTQLPEVQTQQSVVKPAEPKSWNKVVSGGQNKQQHPPPHQLVMGQRSKPHVQQQAPPPQAANVQQKKPPAQQRSQPSPKFHYASDQNGQRSKENTPAPQPAVQQPMAMAKQHRSTSNDDNGGGTPSPPPQQHNLRPRPDWPHRIYFNHLDKPVKYVDNKEGQQELMKELKAITEGIEFVAIKPNSLRKDYKFAFGFIDFTTAEDMQAIYEACKKGGDKNRLKVKIPHFEFDGQITLTSEKTNNLGGTGGGNFGSSGNGGGHFGSGGGPRPHHQQQQQNFHRRGSGGGGGEQRKMVVASAAKG